MDFDELSESIKSDTIKNRDNSLKVFRGIPTKEVISLLIEIMKKYSSEEENTAEYMVILDAAYTVLTERNVIPKVETWTLEEFLNDVPFHSEIMGDIHPEM
jgi:hypothetical protein